jgi:hypothetical protein
LEPTQRELRYIYDLERIKTLAAASEIIYIADKQDITFSGGTMESIGNTIAERVKKNVYGEQMMFAISMWRRINEKIPAPVIKNWEEISEVSKDRQGR